MAAGVYLHIPFCKSRCSYCDFATDVWRDSNAVDRYVDALCHEIRESGRHPVATALGSDLIADTVYFGGGTPSLQSPSQIEKILEAVNNEFSIDPAAEITMEMNPATVTSDNLAGYRSLGVDRASFGVQTFNDRDLKLLARGHNADDARTTFKLLRETGFDNISFDLIIGLPGQTLDDWQKNLDEALSMQPEHLSLYLLEIHQGTPLAEQIRSERRPMPDPELAAEMYELMLERTAAAGHKQYEISNFAKPGFESRHNTKYWRLDPVYGFGVSAHSFDGYQRYSNERDTAAYVKRMEEFGGAEVTRERIDAASEFVFLGLRMTDGIDLDDYQRRFGMDLRETYAKDLNDFADSGLVTLSDNNLRLTPKGMLYSNEVFSVFV
ncbi:MAG TPA: radical SAM family heme chaperone HemW [Pyrinomonadaceae bacterium]|jgi:oxygen-independent coproporphyrinogen-3 oxidase|nr:radical SAM family heme chaperone HemW [Pyrinomonadaceae bacterium]